MRMSWKKLHQESYTKPAMEVVRVVVGALRARGMKTPAAVRNVAPELGITERRVCSLFYRDGDPIVLADEWHALRVRAAAMLRREVDQLRFVAERYEAQADALESAQSSLWGETPCRGLKERRVAHGDCALEQGHAV